MNGKGLIDAVVAVDWTANITSFDSSPERAKAVAEASVLLARWSKELETADKRNPSLSFIREMQVQGQFAATLIVLGLYKPAATAMRAMFEAALYYTYFRTHLAELDTLIRTPSYFVDKRSLFDYHKVHTPNFREKQMALGLMSDVDAWYAETSAVIHGQIPDKWATTQRIRDIAFAEDVCREAIDTFVAGGSLVHRLLLVTMDGGR